jgi:large subunit ribosomal protein L25
MKTLTLEVLPRTETGKGVARQLRREGLIPAVIYGHKSTKSLAVRLKDLQQILKREGGANALLELTVDGKKKTALLKDVQHDPILRVPIHADHFEVSMDQKIKVMVEVKKTEADPVGLKTGGILTHTTTEVEVECLPMEIPESFLVDLSELDIGDACHVSDVPNLGLKILTPGSQVLFAMVAPTVEAEPEPDEVEEGEVVEGAPAEEGEAKPETAEETPESKKKE